MLKEKIRAGNPIIMGMPRALASVVLGIPRAAVEGQSATDREELEHELFRMTVEAKLKAQRRRARAAEALTKW